MTLAATSRGIQRTRQRAFTLASLMVASAILVMVLMGALSAQLFGLRMYQITEAKLGANADSRKVLARLISDAHSAQKWRLGTWSAGAFVEVLPNTNLTGNAVLFYSTALDTNTYVRYYIDTNDNTFKRYSNLPLATNVVATGLSNTVVFTATDFNGVTLTNKTTRAVLKVTLQFTQLRNPDMDIGPGQYYTSYQLRSKVTLRGQE